MTDAEGDALEVLEQLPLVSAAHGVYLVRVVGEDAALFEVLHGSGEKVLGEIHILDHVLVILLFRERVGVEADAVELSHTVDDVLPLALDKPDVAAGISLPPLLELLEDS